MVKGKRARETGREREKEGKREKEEDSHIWYLHASDTFGETILIIVVDIACPDMIIIIIIHPLLDVYFNVKHMRYSKRSTRHHGHR